MGGKVFIGDQISKTNKVGFFSCFCKSFTHVPYTFTSDQRVLHEVVTKCNESKTLPHISGRGLHHIIKIEAVHQTAVLSQYIKGRQREILKTNARGSHVDSSLN